MDGSQKEAKIIEFFIRRQKLPKKYDYNIAKSAAEFFGIDSLNICLNEVKPKMSEFKTMVWKDRATADPLCGECKQRINNGRVFYESKIHLINIHQAKIKESYYHKNGEWGITYRIPVSDKAHQ